MQEHHSEGFTAFVKISWAWFWVGVSNFSPLQAVQFFGGIVATVYTLVQLYVVVRDKIIHREGKKE